MNGWHRLWVVVSGVWMLFWATEVYDLIHRSGFEYRDTLTSLVAIAVGGPVVMYAIGACIAWIRRGFSSAKN